MFGNWASTDSNGRITHNGHQFLDISYNVLNFPKAITNDEGMAATNTYRLSEGNGELCHVRLEDGVVNIEGTSMGLFFHEIRHVGQFLENHMNPRFSEEGLLFNQATTKSAGQKNEIDAYKMQATMVGPMPYPIISLSHIDSTYLFNIFTSDGYRVYQALF